MGDTPPPRWAISQFTSVPARVSPVRSYSAQILSDTVAWLKIKVL
jgi:hypothetical protein